MKGTSQTHLSIETLVETSPSIRTIAQWLNEEWGRGRGYSYEDTLSWCRDLASSESEAIICANLAGRLVGVALLVDCDLPSHPHFSPWLSSLFVAPKYRGQGVGRSLTNRLCEIAEQRGHAEVHLYALEGPSISFYRQLGWAELEKVEIAGGEFVVMKKALRTMDTT